MVFETGVSSDEGCDLFLIEGVKRLNSVPGGQGNTVGHRRIERYDHVLMLGCQCLKLRDQDRAIRLQTAPLLFPTGGGRAP